MSIPLNQTTMAKGHETGKYTEAYISVYGLTTLKMPIPVQLAIVGNIQLVLNMSDQGLPLDLGLKAGRALY